MKISPPGKMVEASGGQLHVHVQGQGGPVVVLEAGIAASSLSWALVQPAVAAFTTVLSYDRAGFGWSDKAACRSTAGEAAEDLALLLENAGLAPPFVLVGHSFGGLIVRVFEQRYPDLVAGMVLVDPVVRSEWGEMTAERARLLARGVHLSRIGALLDTLGMVRAGLSALIGGSRRFPQLLARLSAGGASSVAARFVKQVRMLPPELWPAIAAHWSEARCFRAMAANLEGLPASVRQLDESRPMEDIPLIVISADKGNEEHARDAGLSERGRVVSAPELGHWIQLDAPDLVVDAVREVVGRCRAGSL
ncbi:MAG: alpha/beta hydrolase [Acidobacteriota bacterium]|nr:alpha/beta hydrolase [Acidobacteriota bacterium]